MELRAGSEATYSHGFKPQVSPEALARALLRPILEALGLTRTQYLITALLWERDGMTVSSMAECLGLQEDRVRRAISKMEGRDLVERNYLTGPENVWLTPRGWSFRAQAPDVPSELLRQAFALSDAASHPSPRAL